MTCHTLQFLKKQNNNINYSIKIFFNKNQNTPTISGDLIGMFANFVGLSSKFNFLFTFLNPKRFKAESLASFSMFKEKVVKIKKK